MRLTHVSDHKLKFRRIAFHSPQHTRAALQDDPVSVLPAKPVFKIMNRLPLHQPLVGTSHHRHIGGVNPFVRIDGCQLIRPVPQHALKCRVRIPGAHIRTGNKNCIVRILNQQPVMLLALSCAGLQLRMNQRITKLIADDFNHVHIFVTKLLVFRRA